MINDSLTALSALQRNLSPLGTVNTLWNSAVTAGYTRFDGLGVLEKTEMLSASSAAQTAIAAMCAPNPFTKGDARFYGVITWTGTVYESPKKNRYRVRRIGCLVKYGNCFAGSRRIRRWPSIPQSLTTRQ